MGLLSFEMNGQRARVDEYGMFIDAVLEKVRNKTCLFFGVG